MIGVVQEITDRKRAEEALRASEELFRTVVETSPDGITMMDLKTNRYVLMSPVAARVTGFGIEEFLALPGQELIDRIHPEDRKRAMKQQRDVGMGLDAGPVEYRWRIKDGSYRWFHDHRKLVRDETGKPSALVGVIRDVTERKKVQAALEQSRAVLEQERARLQAIVDTLPVGLYVTDAEGGILRSNKEANQIWRGGKPPKDIREYSAYSARWPDTGAPVEEEEWPASRALLQDQTTEGMIVDIERFDGTEGTIVLSGAPIHNEAHQVTGAVVVVQDISELRDAQKRLEEADRRKNEFLAVLSHELRNPLTPMKNSLHILQKAAPGSPQAERAHEVLLRQLRQLSMLIDDLLDITRIATGKIVLQKRPLELKQLVNNTLDDYRESFRKQNIQLSVQLPEEDVNIEADALRVAQVLSNLLNNAAKFTPASGQVNVLLTADSRGARISVSDTGPGLTKNVMKHLFEPFMQADTTLDRSQGGLGLGLALVKGLVTLHGGEVFACSDGPGKGSTFTVQLPLSMELHPDASAELKKSDSFRKVLIIEDNVDAAESFKELLELDGHDVRIAGTGPKALEIARAFHPDIVFCDIGLLGMSGYQVAQAFRADEKLQHIRMVALSGYALPSDVQQAKESGFDEHVTKPPRLERLYELIAEPPRIH